MSFTPGKLNVYLMTNLPSAWITGVRVKQIDADSCKVGVKHSWINQNPFKSMYFAVQAMAAELSTGALVMQQIKASNKMVSMLVAQNKAVFTKKAKGKIMFTSVDGHLVNQAIENTIATGQGQTFWMKSTGLNETGEVVSEFDFEWTVKLKS
ncbi:DUF4442 domain-containing protein [Salegentibacter flavus]|uniref:Acyl-coenzyme A thioesterase PaaI, contains HGG motif n=1 Tax=Salegentibacter flavus TaxID=287099 RepID=A0A1I5CF99_9FLAO|nr:DUF4442 domain-containing protein [Salegentibacter flavus]SFN85492.1 protein of unknown function [Salegentibacter flavus]